MPLFGPPNVETLKARRDVKGLVKALRHANWEIRRDAASALGELGDPQALEALVSALQDQESAVRYRAIVALGQLRDRRAVPALMNRLIGDRMAGQTGLSVEAAIEALGRIGDARAIPALAPGLEDTYDRNVQATLQALAAIGDPSAIEPLLRYARNAPYASYHEDLLTRALARIGPPAVAPLVRFLADEKGRRVVPALARMRAADSLLAAFRSGSGRVRKHALEALASLPDPDERVVDALATALHDEDIYLRCAAAEGLAKVRSPQALEALVAELGDAEGNWRGEIARVLGRNKRADAVVALVGLLHDPVTEVRLDAIFAVGLLASPAGYLADTLAPLLKDEDARVRTHAAEALGKIPLPSDPEVRAWYANAKKDLNWQARGEALVTLAGLGIALDDARLASALKDLGQAAVQDTGHYVRGEMVDEDQWGPIYASTHRADPDARRSLLRGWESTWGPIYAPTHRADPKKVAERDRARELLSQIVLKLEERGDVPQLIAALAAEGCGAVRGTILAALQRQTGQDLGPDAGQWQAWWQQQRGSPSDP